MNKFIAWCHLDSLGLTLSYVVSLGLMWTLLVSLGLTGSHLVFFCLYKPTQAPTIPRTWLDATRTPRAHTRLGRPLPPHFPDAAARCLEGADPFKTRPGRGPHPLRPPALSGSIQSGELQFLQPRAAPRTWFGNPLSGPIPSALHRPECYYWAASSSRASLTSSRDRRP